MTQEKSAKSALWIDTHCHLPFDGKLPDEFNRAVDAGVEKMVCVGTDAETSKQSVDLAVFAGERVRAAVGLHPHEAKNGLESTIAILDDALRINPGIVVGIGECGLDFFYEFSPKEIQKKVFAEQIELAKQHDLALIVHTRDAWKDTFDILRSEGAPPRTVLHCFTGGMEEIQVALELGFWISFSGIVTFKNAKEVQEAARFCPLERMVIETDSPFLAPIPFRGKPNEPAFVGVIGRFISSLKGTEEDQFAADIYTSTKNLFNF